MRLVGRRVELDSYEMGLLDMACGLTTVVVDELDAFADWLVSPFQDDQSALAHGARCALAQHLTAALLAPQQPGSKRIWAVSRHVGALAWLYLEGVRPHHVVAHLDANDVAPGDLVVGVLPLSLTIALESRGVKAWHIVIDAEQQDRGRELGPSRMRQCNARLERYAIRRINAECEPVTLSRPRCVLKVVPTLPTSEYHNARPGHSE